MKHKNGASITKKRKKQKKKPTSQRMFRDRKIKKN
jgi:hypothetical protein